MGRCFLLKLPTLSMPADSELTRASEELTESPYSHILKMSYLQIYYPQ